MTKDSSFWSVSTISANNKLMLALVGLIALLATGQQVAVAQAVGDFDGNGQVEDSDLGPLVLALTNRDSYNSAYPGMNVEAVGDLNQDGSLNFGDLGELNGSANSSVSSPGGVGSLDIYFSTSTTPGIVSQGAPVVDISSGGSGSLGIWVDPGSFGLLNGISLDLVSDTPGVVAFSNSSFVPNPSVTGGFRWYDEDFPGYNIETITANSMTNIIGVALDAGQGGNTGQGLGHPATLSTTRAAALICLR